VATNWINKDETSRPAAFGQHQLFTRIDLFTVSFFSKYRQQQQQQTIK